MDFEALMNLPSILFDDYGEVVFSMNIGDLIDLIDFEINPGQTSILNEVSFYEKYPFKNDGYPYLKVFQTKTNLSGLKHPGVPISASAPDIGVWFRWA